LIKRPKPNIKKGHLIVQSIFGFDILLCLAVFTLFTLLFYSGKLQGQIISYEIIEQFSLPSSIIGFCLAVILFLNINYFGSTFRGTFLFLKISIVDGIVHLVCAFALILYRATSVGMLPIDLGHIYRDYGYIHLANAISFFALFGYFLLSIRPLSSKG
jgi:hypothetical protein